MEVLIIVALIALLALVAILALNPQTQLKKSRDTRRKNDLEKVQNKLESHFSDKGYYPTITCEDEEECCQELEKNDSLLSPYLEAIPSDPISLRKYLYCSQPEKSQWYKIFTNIENLSDPQLAKNPCQPGCLKSSKTYNYVVASPNVTFENDLDPRTCSRGNTPYSPEGCVTLEDYCPPQGNPSCCSGGALFCQDNLYWCCP